MPVAGWDKGSAGFRTTIWFVDFYPNDLGDDMARKLKIDQLTLKSFVTLTNTLVLQGGVTTTLPDSVTPECNEITAPSRCGSGL